MTPHWTEKILQDLQNPSWWFTAVIVAIISSILAAYFKDIIGWLVSMVSARMGMWWTRRKIRAIRFAVSCNQDVSLVVIRMGLAVMFAIFLTSLAILFYLIRLEAVVKIPYVISPIIFGTVILVGYRFGNSMLWIVRVLIIKSRARSKRLRRARRRWELQD